MRPNDSTRFWSRVDKTGDCWIWTGPRTGSGYGRLGWSGAYICAHRLAYELEVGPIPDGLEVDHLCCNRLCVKPVHLEAVTRQENMARGMARRTHCRAGHPYDAENTILRADGWRECRACHHAQVASDHYQEWRQAYNQRPDQVEKARLRARAWKAKNRPG